MIDNLMKEYKDNYEKFPNYSSDRVLWLMLIDKIDTLNRKLEAIERTLIARL